MMKRTKMENMQSIFRKLLLIYMVLYISTHNPLSISKSGRLPHQPMENPLSSGMSKNDRAAKLKPNGKNML